MFLSKFCREIGKSGYRNWSHFSGLAVSQALALGYEFSVSRGLRRTHGHEKLCFHASALAGMEMGKSARKDKRQNYADCLAGEGRRGLRFPSGLIFFLALRRN